jgi:formamidopyrimidine-DNA glycosylase
MPELPEVQTVINTLKTSGLLNKIIIKTNVYRPKILKNCNPIQFNKFMVHEKFINIERIGKYLIFHLSNKKILAIHLRMEGKLFYEPLQIQYKKQHLRIEMLLNNHHVLRFYDSRMFGTFDIYKNDDYLKAKSIKKLALDPLNSKFT